MRWVYSSLKGKMNTAELHLDELFCSWKGNLHNEITCDIEYQMALNYNYLLYFTFLDLFPLSWFSSPFSPIYSFSLH